MKKSLVIFDFDGTIANTLDSIIIIMNDLSDEFGFRKIKNDDIKYLRDKRPKEILKYLGISLFKLPFVISKARKEINSNIAILHTSVELLPILEILKNNGCQVGILTTNTKENVKAFLDVNNLEYQFDFIYTASKVFGKNRTLLKIIKDKKIKKLDTVYYVGDEVRDVQAGKKVKVRTIVVCWGYNTQKALLKENPDHIINSPSELEEIILS